MCPIVNADNTHYTAFSIDLTNRRYNPADANVLFADLKLIKRHASDCPEVVLIFIKEMTGKCEAECRHLFF